MNRAQLIERLSALPFDNQEYWLAAGGAMVCYDFREETRDVDLGCSTHLAEVLEQEGYPTTVLKDGTRRIEFADDVEIYENWLQDKVILQEGIPVVSVRGLILMKEHLGREKDFRDIALIRMCMEKRGENV